MWDGINFYLALSPNNKGSSCLTAADHSGFNKSRREAGQHCAQEIWSALSTFTCYQPCLTRATSTQQQMTDYFPGPPLALISDHSNFNIVSNCRRERLDFHVDCRIWITDATNNATNRISIQYKQKPSTSIYVFLQMDPLMIDVGHNENVFIRPTLTASTTLTKNDSCCVSKGEWWTMQRNAQGFCWHSCGHHHLEQLNESSFVKYLNAHRFKQLRRLEW